MAFFLSWQFLPHGSWKVVFFTASILSSWNATVWAEVTITQTPTKAVVGRSIMLSVQSDQKNILSFTWFRNSKNNQFCVIRPGENYKNCTNQNPGHVITYSNGSLILQNLSSRDSGLYLIKVNSLEGMEFWSEKYIQVNDSWESPRTSQPGEVNLIFIVAIAVLAGLVIIGGLSCILFIRHTKRNSKKQLEDLGPDGKRHVTRIHIFQTYENDSQSQVLHTYENQSQSPVLPTYENHPQARDGMAITQNQSFASASFSTLSEKPYEEIDASQVDVYDQIVHTRSQGRRKL